MNKAVSGFFMTIHKTEKIFENNSEMMFISFVSALSQLIWSTIAITIKIKDKSSLPLLDVNSLSI